MGFRAPGVVVSVVVVVVVCRESVGRGIVAMRGRKHASKACFSRVSLTGGSLVEFGRGETAMILSAGAREVRGEGVGLLGWA